METSQLISSLSHNVYCENSKGYINIYHMCLKLFWGTMFFIAMLGILSLVYWAGEVL